jgi:alkanesulfonate monooxygenase SsuD/methylene tetrahydromethanopterin reductase-like flavin-dependent oxidoreductase (luciferase family)
VEKKLRVMLQAWTGEPFDYEGTTVRVTPKPLSQPHPLVFVGGSTEIAARRAGRLGLGFQPALHDPQLLAWYEEEARANGHQPGMVIMPSPVVSNVFVAEDPDAVWDEVGENLLYDTKTYAAWQRPGQRSAVHNESQTVAELRETPLFRIMTPDECVAFAKETPVLVFHPLCGGISPDPAWTSLRLFEDEVLPRL